MLDTEPLAARAWSDAASACGVDFDMALARRMIGRTSPTAATLILAHHGDDYPVDALMAAGTAPTTRSSSARDSR